MVEFETRLKQLMDERGLNMYALSKRSGVSWNTIKNFFVRKTKPNIATLAMLCNGLEISMAQFFEEDAKAAHLTAEQQHLINRWNQLNDKEKQTISDTMDLLLAQRR